MTNQSVGPRRTLWVVVALVVLIAVVIVVILISNADNPVESLASSTTTGSPASSETTPVSPSTTTAPASTAPSTTSTLPGPPATSVDVTPIVGILQAYNPAGESLFNSGSIEAHWYQWEDTYVVLYRGLNAESSPPICPGNSVDLGEGRFRWVSNAPFGGNPDEVCVSVPKLADTDSGVRACGPLLYYITEIPLDEDGVLYGTVEVNDGSGFIGLTSQAATDLAATPEFTPGQPAYELPPSGVDAGGVVVCG